MKMTKDAKYRLCGAVAGTVSGLFGGGGGIPLVLMLGKWLKIEQKSALATSVAVIFPCCAVSSAVFLLRGSYSLSQALPYLLGGAAGGFIGGKLFQKLPPAALRRIFAVFLLYGALRYLGVVQ